MNWITGFAAFLIIVGVITGTLLGGLNPWTDPAEAESIHVENEHQHIMNQLDEQLAQAKTEADIQAVHNQQALENAKYEHEMQLLEQDLIHRDIAFKMRMNVLTFMSYLLTATGTILATIWAGKKILTTTQKSAAQAEVQATTTPPSGTHPLSAPEKTPTTPWISPSYRRQRIEAARQEERNQRKNTTCPQISSYKDPARISKEEYKRRPLAGD
ncbi:MAG: hypothetical protein HY869_07760 [Chloroflexi bacterium]|nr:hypothetical protein [Chloroflexota bacterium]